MSTALSIALLRVSTGTRGDTWTPERCQHLGMSFTPRPLPICLSPSPLLPSYTHTHTHTHTRAWHTPGSANIIYDFSPKMSIFPGYLRVRIFEIILHFLSNFQKELRKVPRTRPGERQAGCRSLMEDSASPSSLWTAQPPGSCPPTSAKHPAEKQPQRINDLLLVLGSEQRGS